MNLGNKKLTSAGAMRLQLNHAKRLTTTNGDSPPVGGVGRSRDMQHLPSHPIANIGDPGSTNV